MRNDRKNISVKYQPYININNIRNSYHTLKKLLQNIKLRNTIHTTTIRKQLPPIT